MTRPRDHRGPKLCECGCGTPAPIAKQSNAKKGHVAGQPVRFVSGGHAKRKSPMAYVEKGDGCWRWTGGHYSNGYGRYRAYGTSTNAHRVIYELLVGPIPDGLHMDHLCRNRGCVNPEHLEPVTPAENNRRAVLANLGPPEHGSRRLYWAGCRCEICRAGRLERDRARRKGGRNEAA